MRNWLLILVGTIMLSACTKNFQVAMQKDSKWELIKWGGKPLPAELKATFNLSSGQKISGKSFCNSYSGSIIVNGNAVKIGPLIGTKMFCQAVGDAETKYLFDLEHANAATITGKKLTLMKDGVVVMVFRQTE